MAAEMIIEIKKLEKGKYWLIGRYSLETIKEIKIGKCKDIFGNVDWECTSSKKTDNCIQIIFSNNETATFTHNNEMQIRYKNVDYEQEEPQRQKVREPYTREELEAVYDKKIEAEVKHWGEYSFWANMAREVKAKRLEEFDAGKVVEVYSNEYHADGMDWVDNYYSDGTTDKSCFGYSD